MPRAIMAQARWIELHTLPNAAKSDQLQNQGNPRVQPQALALCAPRAASMPGRRIQEIEPWRNAWECSGLQGVSATSSSWSVGIVSQLIRPCSLLPAQAFAGTSKKRLENCPTLFLQMCHLPPHLATATTARAPGPKAARRQGPPRCSQDNRWRWSCWAAITIWRSRPCWITSMAPAWPQNSCNQASRQISAAWRKPSP